MISRVNEKDEITTDEQEQDLHTPATTQEMVDTTLEVLKGEGEPVEDRAPSAPFVIVFMSYFIVLLILGAILALAIWILRGSGEELQGNLTEGVRHFATVFSQKISSAAFD